MVCPECRHSLPARYALAVRAMKLSCPACRVGLRATRESLATTAKIVGPPCTWVGSIVGGIAVFVAVKFDNWWMFVAASVVIFLLSLLWSWQVGLKHVEFERA